MSRFSDRRSYQHPKRNLRNLRNLRILRTLPRLPRRGAMHVPAINSIRVHSRFAFVFGSLYLRKFYPGEFRGCVHLRLVSLTWPNAAGSVTHRRARGLTCANLVRTVRLTSRIEWSDSVPWYGKVHAAAHRWRFPAPRIIGEHSD